MPVPTRGVAWCFADPEHWELPLVEAALQPAQLFGMVPGRATGWFGETVSQQNGVSLGEGASQAGASGQPRFGLGALLAYLTRSVGSDGEEVCHFGSFIAE